MVSKGLSSPPQQMLIPPIYGSPPFPKILNISSLDT